MERTESEPARLSVYVERGLRAALEESAHSHGRTLSGALRMALRAYLAEPEPRERITRVETSP